MFSQHWLAILIVDPPPGTQSVPELPEVETIVKDLTSNLPGRKISSVKVLRTDSVAFPSASNFARAVTGLSFIRIFRRGKYLLFDLSGSAGLVVHLRMSGRFLLVAQGAPTSKHSRLSFLLDDGQQLIFEDMRVFGRIWYKPPENSFEEIVPSLAELGKEPLTDLDAAYMHSAFKKRSQAIKTVLLDQRVIAGIGNIYADEVLYLSGIHPLRRAMDLGESELDTLVRSIRQVLSQAIALGGSSLRNYTNVRGIHGQYQGQSLVYGRTGAPCLTCQNPLVKIRIAGRSTHYCQLCQRQAADSGKNSR